MEKGFVHESLVFYSESLRRYMKYSIYLPSNYESDFRKFPLVYLMHGYNGNELNWIQKGQIDQTLNYLIYKQEIPPFVVVMPDAGNSWYIDSSEDNKYESAIVNDLANYIEERFEVSSERENKFICGLSMGGYGALKIAYKYPTKFYAVGSLSGVITRQIPPKEKIETVRDDNWPFTSENWEKEKIFNYIDSLKQSGVNMPTYLTCGYDDFLGLYLGACDLHHQLQMKKLPSELHIKAGNHNWKFWKEEIKEVLKFFTKIIELY